MSNVTRAKVLAAQAGENHGEKWGLTRYFWFLELLELYIYTHLGFSLLVFALLFVCLHVDHDDVTNASLCLCLFIYIYTTQTFSSADESWKEETRLLLLWVGPLVTLHTIVFTYIASVVKPLFVFVICFVFIECLLFNVIILIVV